MLAEDGSCSRVLVLYILYTVCSHIIVVQNEGVKKKLSVCGEHVEAVGPTNAASKTGRTKTDV